MEQRMSFVRNEGGAITLFLAFAFVVLAGFAGLGVDYVRTQRVSDRIQHASDAAVLAAVKYAAEQTALGREAAAIVTEAEGVGQTLWTTNLVRLEGSHEAPSITLEQAGQAWKARMEASGSVPTTLAAVMGLPTMNYRIQAEATSEAGTPYMDFYLLLDTSQSMGLAATSAGMSQLNAGTGCQFGCHVTGESATYDYAKANGVPMRIDILRAATDKVIQKAQDTAVKADQFRIGLWSYDRSLAKLSDLDTNYATLKSAAGLIDLPTYNDGTQTDDALGQLNSVVVSSGNGRTADSPVKFLFLVTDGVQDGIYTGWSTPVGLPTNYPYSPYDGIPSYRTSPITPTACDAIKAKGVTVVVLYTTFVPFPGFWQYDDLVKPFGTQIAANLKSCASPGFFFEATEGPEIDAAMQRMFAAAVAFGSGPRIVK